MVSKKDFFTYTKIIFILTICFGLIGNYIYVENFKPLISNYNYHDEPINSLFHKQYDDFVLEGGHEYIFYFFLEGPHDVYLNINMIFETMDNITISYGTGVNESWLEYWGEDRIYTEPLYIPQNETIFISVQMTAPGTSYGSSHWQMLVYQDLPMWLTKPIPIIVFFTILLLVIWAIAYEKYEKIFTDIKNQKRKLVEKTEEVRNVE
ncbi:hypothetical protein DSAG12_01398 [Promethearchaeum syntrophicum]|uniref:Uncharacterized protein n=1 Tax=Promethearchaeum syntrophicum TaxID=2594042 RepID=A0A5B9D900_9ARCH|nr:hypothetical protein [Candidatus Prometheoarchaeum syntrophicum]QEE15572.1 hypothetical protein DSAG12_01398 [Candidatus Prometheoarchaeum syntrophicum]